MYIKIFKYQIPLICPLHLQGITLKQREGFFVQNDVGDFGEASPLPGFSPENMAETAADLLAARDSFKREKQYLPKTASVSFALYMMMHPLKNISSKQPYIFLLGSPENIYIKLAVIASKAFIADKTEIVKIKTGIYEQSRERLLLKKAGEAGRSKADFLHPSN